MSFPKCIKYQTLSYNYWGGFWVSINYPILNFKKTVGPKNVWMWHWSVKKLSRIFRQSNSKLDYFSKSLITNFNYVNIGLPCGYFIFLQALCKTFRAGASHAIEVNVHLWRSWCSMNFLLFFHTNLCFLFILANVCQLHFVAFRNESCQFVAQESLSMFIAQSCKEVYILYEWWRVLFSVLRK